MDAIQPVRLPGQSSLRERGAAILCGALPVAALLLTACNWVYADEPSSALTGRLFICGGGQLPAQVGNRFVEMAGGRQARVVVVTTASVLADTERIATKLAFWREQDLASLEILHTRSRVTADEPAFCRPLSEATGVWFIGGNQNWLTQTYLGTATEKAIRCVLERGGVIGGTSAGAAIMSPLMICRDRPELETGPGFGFLPGTVVDQHFIKRNRQGRLLRVLANHPELVGLGIDEGTALVVEGSRLSVLGDSRVVVCKPAVDDDHPADVQMLEPGSEADLEALYSKAFTSLKVAASASQPSAEQPDATSESVSKDIAPKAADVPAQSTMGN